jgi:hypothetical protein
VLQRSYNNVLETAVCECKIDVRGVFVSGRCVGGSLWSGGCELINELFGRVGGGAIG